MTEPQEIKDEEYEQVLGRVAAVDVAKASGMVYLRVADTARVDAAGNLRQPRKT